MYCCPIFNQSTYNTKRHRTLAHIKTTIKIFQFTNWKAFTTNVIIFIYWLPAWDTYKFLTRFMMQHAHCYCVVNGWLFLNIHYIMTSKILKLESLLVVGWLLSWKLVYIQVPALVLFHPYKKFPPPSFVDQFLLFIPDSNKRPPHVFIDEYSPKMTWLHPLL